MYACDAEQTSIVEVSPFLQELNRLAFVPGDSTPDLLVDRYEVTNLEYLQFVNATGYRGAGEGFLNHLSIEDGNYYVTAEQTYHPVVFVNRDDAQAYAAWRQKRLPQKYEWERAACKTPVRFSLQTTVSNPYPWGRFWNPSSANTGELAIGASTPVGAFERGRSIYGCYDLAGNVWEWVYFDNTIDLLGNVINVDLSPETIAEMAVIKGGAFDTHHQRARCDVEYLVESQIRSIDLGFRCVVDFDVYMKTHQADFALAAEERRIFFAIVRRWGSDALPALERLTLAEKFPAGLFQAIRTELGK